MHIHKDIAELLKAEVISPETADRIQAYYADKQKPSSNRLLLVFGVLGAILVGLGIILIVAHNWDTLGRPAKTFFAFLPLLAAQLLCAFVLLKKSDNTVWRESGTAFLFFAVGASISLVSQIYHIPGNLSSFLLTWMFLCLPLLYVMQSSAASLLYVVGISYYAVETSYWSYPYSESYFYWLLLLLALPYYYWLQKRNPESNFVRFHNWVVPLSVIIVLGTLAQGKAELLFVAYFSLFGLLYLIGDMDIAGHGTRAYKVLGSLGTVVLLLFLSFDWFWEDLQKRSWYLGEVFDSVEFLATALLSLLAAGLLYYSRRHNRQDEPKPIAFVFLFFIPTFLLGFSSSIVVVLINLYLLAIGVLTIRAGGKQDHLGLLNYGLLIIAALVVCRFFDTKLSFVLRGSLFVMVGVGFFAANYWMLKKRKTNA